MSTRRVAVVATAVLTALVLSACASDSSAGSTGSTSDLPPVPPLDAERVAQGEAIYGRYCAACHGADLSGDPEWKIRNADGSLKPPPHDATGHTWHHADDLLISLTRDGDDSPESRMPQFGDTLTDEEIGAVFEFIKSNWGPEERGFQWRVTWTDQQLNAG